MRNQVHYTQYSVQPSQTLSFSVVFCARKLRWLSFLKTQYCIYIVKVNLRESWRSRLIFRLDSTSDRMSVKREPGLVVSRWAGNMGSCRSEGSHLKLLTSHRELLVEQVKNTQCVLDNLQMNGFICTEDIEIIHRSSTRTDQVPH